MKWRPRLYVLHRDVGFLCLGLTVVYAVSGIAVNHRHHWDYNYSERSDVVAAGTPAVLLGVPEADPGALARRRQDEVVARLCTLLDRPAPRKSFWRGPDTLSLFFGKADSDVADYAPSTGRLEHRHKQPRLLVRAFNTLHLNERRAVWTWIGDGYAALLLFLALSGTLMVRGQRGFVGRGGIFAAIGIGVPIAVLWLTG